MFYYKIYGLTLESDYEFTQFLSIDKPEGETDIVIRHGMPDYVMDMVNRGYWSADKPHSKWFRNGVGIFWIHEDRIIHFLEYGGKVDEAALYLPGMCLSILLWFRKMIMIHGACLHYKDKTIIISGNSGAGKSTLSNELIKKGALLIADDLAGIAGEDGTFYSYPAFPVQKLCMDQIEKNNIDVTGLKQIAYDLNKYEIPRMEIFYNQKSKVDYLFRVEYFGEKEDSASVEDFDLKTMKVDGADKLKVVTDSLFVKFLFDDRFRCEPDDLMRCIGFANEIEIRKIVRNHKYNTLDRILDYIDEQIV